MKNITKTTSFSDSLRKLRKGQTVRVPNTEYSEQTVRSTVCKLRKEGYEFICTTKGCAFSTKITRTA